MAYAQEDADDANKNEGVVDDESDVEVGYNNGESLIVFKEAFQPWLISVEYCYFHYLYSRIICIY